MHHLSLTRALCVLLLLAGSTLAQAAVILPPEGAELNRIHTQFRWTPLSLIDNYQLWVVEDNGSPDPFAGTPAVANLGVDPAEPRVVVTSGLEFGKAYAWRVRGWAYDPSPWGPTHRFSTAPFPEWMLTFTVTIPEERGSIEPGVTIFSVNRPPIPASDVLYVGVDETGQTVWFLIQPRGTGSLRQTGLDLRQLENGRLLWNGAGRAWEGTLAGGIAWASPEPMPFPGQQGSNELANKNHHEVFPMPNGNRMVVHYTWRDIVRDEVVQRWRSDEIVEYDPRTNEVVWSWDLFDHLSTLDFDEDVMSAPSSAGDYNWTHTNSVIYNEADNSVYISVRHLSRIVRIDYDTGNIVYQMGFDMPSGDVDFGDNLFSFQHAPEMLPNGNMLVYDNGNRADHVIQTDETGVTKAIELEFSGGDPPTSASIVWEYQLPEYSDFVGDVDRLPGGNTLVSMGGTNTGTDRSVLEINPSAQEIWRLTADADGVIIYRAERVGSLILDTPGDTDGDWDLDLGDYAQLQLCFTGEGPAGLTFPCTLSDADNDDDVDLDDLHELVRWRTGPL